MRSHHCGAEKVKIQELLFSPDVLWLLCIALLHTTQSWKKGSGNIRSYELSASSEHSEYFEGLLHYLGFCCAVFLALWLLPYFSLRGNKPKILLWLFSNSWRNVVNYQSHIADFRPPPHTHMRKKTRREIEAEDVYRWRKEKTLSALHLDQSYSKHLQTLLLHLTNQWHML